jgi:hypothetical protein
MIETATIAYYLGVPVLIVEDHHNGWVTALWPDKENPGRSHKKPKPFTYRKLEWWKFWKDQLKTDGAAEVEFPSFPVQLAPKPVPS